MFISFIANVWHVQTSAALHTDCSPFRHFKIHPEENDKDAALRMFL